jgi:hypothetical protein
MVSLIGCVVRHDPSPNEFEQRPVFRGKRWKLTMVAGPGKTKAVALLSGVGRVRAGTISIGSHVIAIENVGTIRIVSGRRAWWLFLLGVIIAGGAATQLAAYGALAIAGVGLGIALVLGNLAQRVESGLAIGASDGSTTLIVSRDQVFLQRLLQFLVDRIDSGDHALAADFDIARGILSSPAREAAQTDNVIFADAPAATPPAPETPQVANPSVAPGDSAEDVLFGDPEPEVRGSATEVLPSVKTEVLSPATAPTKAEKRQTFDRLLDGGPRTSSSDKDWLVRPGPAPALQEEPGGGLGRVLLALLIATVLGGGVFAAWYFTGETGPPTSIPAIDIPVQANVEPPVEAPTTQTTDSLQLPIATSLDPESLPAIEPAPPPSPEQGEAATVADFFPPAPMVARASGQRYRASPSMADDVAVLAETRAGGEVLNITGRLMQPDGEWYRVLLADDRDAWFKATLAIARTRFAGWVRPAASGPDASFAASIPQILDPSEGIALGGGSQSVTLDWSHREDASIFNVEIQAYDAESQRWVEDPPQKRTTVEGDTVLVEMFPSTGAWRWRVRGVTLDGQQSQVSRWSAFFIRD